VKVFRVFASAIVMTSVLTSTFSAQITTKTSPRRVVDMWKKHGRGFAFIASDTASPTQPSLSITPALKENGEYLLTLYLEHMGSTAPANVALDVANARGETVGPVRLLPSTDPGLIAEGYDLFIATFTKEQITHGVESAKGADLVIRYTCPNPARDAALILVQFD
jgi:hypothetical protein